MRQEPVKDVTKYKYYEGGVTARGVGVVNGFAFTRHRRGCFCVPEPGVSCSHSGWTGQVNKGSVKPAKPAAAGGGGAPRVTRQAPKRSGAPSKEYRESIDEGSLCCLLGDSDDETADGESIWYVNALGKAEQNTETRQCGPVKLVKNHYSLPVQWLNLHELTDEHAIFKVWPTEQDRLAVAHLLEVPDLKWEKEEGQGESKLYYMSRAQYDTNNEQL